MTSAGKHFWRKILGSSTERHGQFSVINFGGETEISQKEVTIFVEQDIFWLQISVHNLLLVEMSKSNCDLGNHEPGLLFWETSNFDEMSEELTTLDEVHKEENSDRVLENVLHTDYEWVINVVKNILF